MLKVAHFGNHWYNLTNYFIIKTPGIFSSDDFRLSIYSMFLNNFPSYKHILKQCATCHEEEKKKINRHSHLKINLFFSADCHAVFDWCHDTLHCPLQDFCISADIILPCTLSKNKTTMKNYIRAYNCMIWRYWFQEFCLYFYYVYKMMEESRNADTTWGERANLALFPAFVEVYGCKSISLWCLLCC